MAHGISLQKVIRVAKKDSALLYALMEAHEGLTAYTTLDAPEGAGFRDIRLQYSSDQDSDVSDFLKEVGSSISLVERSPEKGSGDVLSC